MNPSIPPFRTDAEPNPRALNRLAEQSQSADREYFRFTPEQDSFPPNAPFAAYITSRLGTAYGWYRLATLAGGTSAQDGFALEGTVSAGGNTLPAYEVTGRDNVAVGTQVLMWFADTGDEMRFVVSAIGPAEQIDISGRSGSVADVTAAQFLRTVVSGTSGATVVTPDNASETLPGDWGTGTQTIPGGKLIKRFSGLGAGVGVLELSNNESVTGIGDGAASLRIEDALFIYDDLVSPGYQLSLFSRIGGSTYGEIRWTGPGVVDAPSFLFRNGEVELAFTGPGPIKFITVLIEASTRFRCNSLDGVSGTGGGGDTVTGGIITALGAAANIQTLLDTISTTADRSIYYNGTDWVPYTLTAAGRSILDDATTTAMLGTLGGTTAGQNLFTLANPGAITFLQINADNTVSALSAAAYATAIGLGTGDSPQLAGVNIGHATDTTLTRTGPGDVAIEGNAIYRAGGTDVPLTDGGTGSSTAAGARTNLGATTVGDNYFTLTNPGAITFPRMNADNTVSALSAADFRTAVGAGTGNGTVTAVTGSNGAASSGGTAPNITMDISGLTANDINFADAIPNYDDSAAANRKITAERLLAFTDCNPGGRLCIDDSFPTPGNTTASALFYSIHLHDRFRQWDGTRWVLRYFRSFGLALTVTSGKNYDAFIFASNATPSSTDTGTDIVTFAAAPGWGTGSFITPLTTGGGLTAGTAYYYRAVSSTTGTFHTSVSDALNNANIVNLTASITSSLYAVSLELSAAWTNDTTRADGLGTQDGVYVKSADATRLWLGTIRASAANTIADTIALRFIWNWYNRLRARVYVFEATNSWTYTTATWRQMNGSSANQIAVVCGLAGAAALHLTAMALALTSNPPPIFVRNGIGEDSTTALATECLPGLQYCTDVMTARPTAVLDKQPALGYHYYTALEYSQAVVTTTWYGDNGDDTLLRNGLLGLWEC